MSAVGSADIHITVLLLHTIHSDIVTQRHIKGVQNIRVIRSACSLSVLVCHVCCSFSTANVLSFACAVVKCACTDVTIRDCAY